MPRARRTLPRRPRRSGRAAIVRRTGPPAGRSRRSRLPTASETMSSRSSAQDRELMAKSPHMRIEGIMIAAHAAQTNHAFIYIRGEYETQARILDLALAEAA